MAESSGISTNIPENCAKCPARIDGLCENATLNTLYRTGDRNVKAGQDLFRQGEPSDRIYTLVDGWLFRYNLQSDGRRQILDFALPGALLGFRAANERLTTYGVQALTNAVVCTIPRTAFGKLLQQRPETGLRVAELSQRDISITYDHLISMGRRSARERVAHLILELYVRCRSQWPGHAINEMILPLTQEHIGDATALTGVHVNRVLKGLKESGILKFSYRRLSILDPDKLLDAAGADPEIIKLWARQGGAELNARAPCAEHQAARAPNMVPDRQAASGAVQSCTTGVHRTH